MEKRSFNPRFMPRESKPQSSNLNRYLNGFDLRTLPQDGKVYYGWTGRAWIVWRDCVILSYGQAQIDIYWVEVLCNTLNGHKAAWFKDLGHEAPQPGSKEFVKWQTIEERKNGFVPKWFSNDAEDTVFEVISEIFKV